MKAAAIKGIEGVLVVMGLTTVYGLHLRTGLMNTEAAIAYRACVIQPAFKKN